MTAEPVNPMAPGWFRFDVVSRRAGSVEDRLRALSAPSAYFSEDSLPALSW